MSKQFFSAVMFALLCTGNISPESLNTTHLRDFNSQTIASYQALSQSTGIHWQNDDDDDEEVKQEAEKA